MNITLALTAATSECLLTMMGPLIAKMDEDDVLEGVGAAVEDGPGDGPS